MANYFNYSSGLFLKLYTNKNRQIFEKGGEKASKHLEGINGEYCVVYDDWDVNPEVVEEINKLHPKLQMFKLAPRSKTVMMDSKISFTRLTKQSHYTPKSYLSMDEIPYEEESYEKLYFVKQNSTGGKGVNICNRKDIKDVYVSGSVIQENMLFPHLYNNRRYKIRAYGVIYEKKWYCFLRSFITVSGVEYKRGRNDRDMHVINQTAKTRFLMSYELDGYETIEKNIIHSMEEMRRLYAKEVSSISGDEYAVLGVDVVVDEDLNVHIIEMNHRSNYGHPLSVSEEADVMMIKDLIILLVTKSTEGTHFVEV